MFRKRLKGKLQSKIDWLIIKFNFVSFCRNPKKYNVSQPATSFVNVVKSEEWKTRKFVVFRWKSPINEVLFTIETVIRISGPIHQVQFVSHCEKNMENLFMILIIMNDFYRNSLNVLPLLWHVKNMVTMKIQVITRVAKALISGQVWKYW